MNYPLSPDRLGTATKTNDVPLACDELSNVVQELDETLLAFQNRLSAITRQEPTEDHANKPSTTESSCTLSGIIREQTFRIRRTIKRINEHHSMLEI